MRSGERSGMWRPSSRFTIVTSSSRPASMRVLHQALPPVETSVTRSPSRTPLVRNWITAALARADWKGVRWMSSNTTTNVRPVCSSGNVLLETRGRGGGVAWGRSGTDTASKLASCWGAPSSSTVNSSWRRSLMGTPFLSVTTTSTFTCSIWAGNLRLSGEGAGAGAAGGCWARRGAAASTHRESKAVGLMEPRLWRAGGLEKNKPRGYPARAPRGPLLPSSRAAAALVERGTMTGGEAGRDSFFMGSAELSLLLLNEDIDRKSVV